MRQLALTLILALPIAAADPGSETREALIRTAKEITRKAASEVASKETWEAVRDNRRLEMREMLGLSPWPERTPLHLEITGKLDRGGYSVEKIAYESLPRIYVTANLYLPGKPARKAPAVIYVCGHSYSPDGAKAKYQRHGITLAKNGYVAMILDPIQISEVFGLHHGVYGQEMPEWYSRGYSPAGVEVWNAMRAIDYLETRSEVDASRIGMTGRSGGAAMTWFTAAVDERVKVAIPVMGISTYAANLKDNTQWRHCDCMFLINTFQHGMLHQGALIAPRPLLMAHGRRDPLFPIPGYEEFERRIGALYESYGKAESFRNVVVDTGHADSDFLREQAVRWFDRHLMGIPEREADMAYEDAPGEELRVFADRLPADAANFRVHETFLPTPEFQRYSSLDAWKSRREELLNTLRGKVFRSFPAEPPPLNLRVAEGDRMVRFTSERGVDVEALLDVPGNADAPLPALLYVAAKGDDPNGLWRMFRQPRPGPRVARMAVIPRGNGSHPWTKSLELDLFRNAMHTGQTVDSMRLWDVLRAVEALRGVAGVDPSRITVSGRGTGAVLALYAAVLDESIHQALLLDPSESHTRGPHFLNVLRYTDVPEAAALLAPRRLSFYSRMPAAFEQTKHIYELYGAGESFFVTMDLLNILEGRYHHNFTSGF